MEREKFLEVYRHSLAHVLTKAVMEHNEMTGIPAEAAGTFVADRALQWKVPVLCTLGGKSNMFVFLTRLLPTQTLTDLVGKIYAS